MHLVTLQGETEELVLRAPAEGPALPPPAPAPAPAADATADATAAAAAAPAPAPTPVGARPAFKPGSTETLRVKGADIGTISYVVVRVDPSTASEGNKQVGAPEASYMERTSWHVLPTPYLLYEV